MTEAACQDKALCKWAFPWTSLDGAGQPEDIGNAVFYLASEASDNLIGGVIFVNSG